MNRIVLLDVKAYQNDYTGFDCSVVAVVEMTPELAKKLLTRVKLAREMREKDNNFLRLIFFDDIDVYESDDVVELEMGEVAYRETNPFGDDAQALDFCQMLVDHDGDIEWRFSAKHSEVTACTSQLRAEELEKFLEDA